MHTLPDLLTYDWIVVNSSAGKDSQAMLEYVAREAKRLGIMNRIIVAHADLGKCEWTGTRELAEEQAAHYGFEFVVVKYRDKFGKEMNLLEYVEKRGKWPSSKQRYCTSDFKRNPSSRIITVLANGTIKDGVASGGSPAFSAARSVAAKGKGRKVRILNCLGFRADESPARAKRIQFACDERLTNGKRHVDTWLPIHTWTVDQVWECIREAGTRWHRAYDLGMPRLSCVFCIFAPEAALLLAGYHNPDLLDEYIGVEERIGHTFKMGLSLASIREKINRKGFVPLKVNNWTM